MKGFIRIFANSQSLFINLTRIAILIVTQVASYKLGVKKREHND